MKTLSYKLDPKLGPPSHPASIVFEGLPVLKIPLIFAERRKRKECLHTQEGHLMSIFIIHLDA
jgi:hypothetical protein